MHSHLFHAAGQEHFNDLRRQAQAAAATRELRPRKARGAKRQIMTRVLHPLRPSSATAAGPC